MSVFVIAQTFITLVKWLANSVSEMRIQSAVVRNGTTNSSWTFTLKCVLLNFPSFKLSAKYIIIPSYILGQSQGCPPFLCNLVIGIHTSEHLRNFEQLIFSWQALLDMLVQRWSSRLWCSDCCTKHGPTQINIPKLVSFLLIATEKWSQCLKSSMFIRQHAWSYSLAQRDSTSCAYQTNIYCS